MAPKEEHDETPSSPGGDGGAVEMTDMTKKQTTVTRTLAMTFVDPDAERDFLREFNVTEDDLDEAKQLAGRMTLQEVRALMQSVRETHAHDPNFPFAVMRKIELFLDGDDTIIASPDKHRALIREMKLEAAIITGNSPYSEVRSVVDNSDDPSMPTSTFRSWTIGIVFSVLLAYTNQRFSVRLAPITIMTNVAQLLAFPLGKAMEKSLPDVGFTLFGTRHSLNPGPFNKKEHMLITVMANVAFAIPYTNFVIWNQFLPQYADQEFASGFGFKLLVSFSANFLGYGIAGLLRHFIVYPAYCIWPESLATVALNTALHPSRYTAPEGPFGRIWRMSRRRFFLFACCAMFVYHWFPDYLFIALSSFSWMTWIAPSNTHLAAVTGFSFGLGLNPLPTFDWSVLAWDNIDPLMVPFFSTFAKFLGTFLSMFIVLGMWYTNAYNTGYLPINSNRVFDNWGFMYNASLVADEEGHFSQELYEAYSPPFLTAGNITSYMFHFAVYTAILTYTVCFHRHHIMQGSQRLLASFRKSSAAAAAADSTEKDNEVSSSSGGGGGGGGPPVNDVHNRLMRAYAEVPQWWYLIPLLTALLFGVVALAAWDTGANPGVVFFGLFLCLLFVLPVGITKAVTGIEVYLMVIAEFIGGAWSTGGDAVATNYFKAFGHVTTVKAVLFSEGLKLGHYLHLPPRHTFAAQLAATFVSTLVCVGVMNWQMNEISDICSPFARNRLSCPSVGVFSTASIIWGTVGPGKVWGLTGMYSAMLVGFPLGFVAVLSLWLARRKFPHASWLRQTHPVLLMHGGTTWAPFNMSNVWPSVPIAWFSWMFLKDRFLGLWSKYNFVLSAAFGCGVALTSMLIYFALDLNQIYIDWWGTLVVGEGCEGNPCTLKKLDYLTSEYFGPRIGDFH